MWGPVLDPVASPPEVEVVDPDRMNLAGLLAAALVRRGVARPGGAVRARALRGTVAVEAGGMRFAIEFGPARVRVLREWPERPSVTIRASLGALLRVALGGSVVGAFLRGGVRFRGNPVTALRMIPLLRPGA